MKADVIRAEVTKIKHELNERASYHSPYQLRTFRKLLKKRERELKSEIEKENKKPEPKPTPQLSFL